MSIEAQIDELWKSEGPKPGSCKFWTEQDAETQLKSLNDVSRVVALIRANKELALLSEDEMVSSLAREMLVAELSSEEKKKLLAIEQVADLIPTKGHHSSTTLQRTFKVCQNLEKVTELIKSKPVEAITSPSTYVRKLAKSVIPSEEYKKLKKNIKTLKGRNK